MKRPSAATVVALMLVAVGGAALLIHFQKHGTVPLGNNETYLIGGCFIGAAFLLRADKLKDFLVAILGALPSVRVARKSDSDDPADHRGT